MKAVSSFLIEGEMEMLELKLQLLNEIKKNVPKKNEFTKNELDLLTKFSFDDDINIKLEVAIILIDFNEERGEDILRRLSRDKNSLVRTYSCESLGFSKSISTYELLKKIILTDKNGMVRGYAILSLFDISERLKLNSDLKEFLINIEKKEKVVFTKINIYKVLYQLTNNKKYLHLLILYLDTNKYQNRCVVVHCFAEIINNKNRDLIISALKNQNIKEKSFAVTSTIDNFLNVC